MRIPGINNLGQFIDLAIAIRAETLEYQMSEREGRSPEKDTDGYRRGYIFHSIIDHQVVPITNDFEDCERKLIAVLEALLLSSSEKLKRQVCEAIVSTFLQFGSIKEEGKAKAENFPVGLAEELVRKYKQKMSKDECETIYNPQLLEYRENLVVNPKWDGFKDTVSSGLTRVSSFFARRKSSSAAALLAAADDDVASAAAAPSALESARQ